MRYFVIILNIVYYIVFVSAAENKNFCKTPNNSSGECKVINSCPSLFSLLQNRPINSVNADYLASSHCGNESSRVCCPISDIPQPLGATEFLKTAESSRSPLLPDHETCGIDSPSRIHGGEKTDIREFPWLVLIENKKKNTKTRFFCGGVLINPRYVLTAAHCLKGKYLPRSFNITTVRLGEYNVNTDPDCVEKDEGIKECAPPVLIVPVEEKIAHEDYNPYDVNQYHDVALLRLAQEVTYTAYIQPICLPNTAHDQTQKFVGRKLTVAGWGETENANGTTSAEKLKVNIPVRENVNCSDIYRERNVQLSNGQICAGGEKDKDSCKGDSGGPLMDMYADENGTINWYSIGIVSYGPTPCGSENWPGVYIKVINYFPWILSKLRT